jgi:acetate kinase
VLLTINAGSSSLKVAVFRDDALERLGTILVTGLGHGATMTSTFAGPPERVERVALDGAGDHDAALDRVLAALAQRLGPVTWRAVGHRVAHGRDHAGPRIIDDEARAALHALIPLAPLHQPHNLAGIAAAERLAPGALQVACFDTSFHRAMPEVARRYALPAALRADGIEAYGFHGLSYEHIASVLPDHLGATADARVIVAHLGSGASMCAMRARTSVATTMGFTPLDGLPMGTRCGDLDPGVVLYLLEARGHSVAEVRDLLYLRSGLLGVSGISDSMQALLASPARAAAEAVELFVYRASGAIGALAAALGGLDALVFTGGIGENSATIRSQIVRQAAWLGAEIDEPAHAAGRAVFSTATSAVALCVLPADEEAVIARHVAAILRHRVDDIGNNTVAARHAMETSSRD